MLKNIDHGVTHLRRGFLIKACLLLAFTALPAVAMQWPTIDLRPNAAFNGYRVKSSPKGKSVTCVGVHASSDKSSSILNGRYVVTVELNNGNRVARTLAFRGGRADFGIIGPSHVKVKTIWVIYT